MLKQHASCPSANSSLLTPSTLTPPLSIIASQLSSTRLIPAFCNKPSFDLTYSVSVFRAWVHLETP